MRLDFFDEDRPVYIAVNQDGFNINGQQFKTLEGFIREITPVRKLFKGKKIECYSNDAKKGKKGEWCAICPKRIKCRPRIRLMLLLKNKETEQTQAQLEINSNSFEPLKRMLEPVEEDELPELLVMLSVEKKNNYLQVQFSAVF